MLRPVVCVTIDANGNVQQLVDASDGSLKAEYEYGPFGGITKSSGTVASDNPFRFSTKYFDDETQLSYYGYRYYDAEKGRWVSRDPVEERGGCGLYGFVSNRALVMVDRHGLTLLPKYTIFPFRWWDLVWRYSADINDVTS